MKVQWRVSGNMKFVITGAHGYVGLYVVRALLELDHKVMAVSHPLYDTVAKGVENISLKGVENISLDVLSGGPDVFTRLGSPDVCVHLAWEAGFDHSNPVHIKNVEKHIAFMESMLAGGLKHLVGIGTMHEIGYHVGPITENTPTVPRHPYGMAKNYLRQIQQLLCERYGAVGQWLRCFYIVGDDRRNNSIFTKILAASSEGRTTFPLNSGELLCDFIKVDELGRQIACVASQTAVTGTINCCSGVPISLKTMVTRFITEHKLAVEPQWGKLPLRPYDSPAIWGDTTKLKIVLEAASRIYSK